MTKELRGKKIDEDEEVKSSISAYFDAKEKIYFFRWYEQIISEIRNMY